MTVRKTKPRARPRVPNVRISFQPRERCAEPPISTAKARQLVKKLESVYRRTGPEEQEPCDEGSCAKWARFTEGLFSAEENMRCKSSCQWFYSAGGGWQLECYIRCTANGWSFEVTL